MNSINNKINLNYLKLKKADFIFIAAVLLIAGIAVIFIYNQKDGDKVNIFYDEKMITYNLSEENEIVINNSDGSYNVVVIHNGYAYMKEADCPNQICVNHKPIYKNGESIVCVPNKVSINIVNSIKNDIDN